MAAPRKRRKPRQYYKGAVIKGNRAVLTTHREHARNLQGLRERARAEGGGGGSGGDDGGGPSGDLGKRLREAAQIFADQAKKNAESWSRQVPPSIQVRGGSTGISIVSGAPPSYPNEVEGVRHPVFGHRHQPWKTNKYRPFLAPAADQRGDEAAEKFAEVIDDWAKERGFK